MYHFWPPFSKGYEFQYKHRKQKKRVDYFIDLDEYNPSIKMNVGKNNDLKNVKHERCIYPI